MARPIKTPFSPDLRTEIRKAAEALFAERGFDGTSLRHIAQEVGATKALVYHYYRNKEDLYLSLLETAVSEVVTHVEEIAVSKEEPAEKIRGVVRVFLDYYRAHPQRFHMVQRAIDEHGAAAATLAERWFSRAHLALQTIAEEGVKQRKFKRLSSHMVPFIVIGLIIHALRDHKLRERTNSAFPATDPLDMLADLVLTLLKAEETSKKKYESAVVRLGRSGRAAGTACPTQIQHPKGQGCRAGSARQKELDKE
jgi:AcrR family transcriptional regulator